MAILGRCDKTFFILKIELELSEKKFVFIWSQIKSFRHNLFMTSNQKTYFTQVSTFDQLNKKMSTEKLKWVLFRHNLFLTSNQKNCFTKVSTLDQLNMKMPSESFYI